MASDLWYRALLSDAQDVARHIAAVGEQFAAAVEAAGWPDGACLFVTSRDVRPGRSHPDGNNENTDTPVDADALFFSPASVSAVPHLIAVCEATPSPPPGRAFATLLVGKQKDWDLLPHQIH